jgi:uncharacterized protein (DUF169 family)
MIMFKTRQDYSIFEKFNFERKPIGIKFLLNRPTGIEQTDKKLPICRMFIEAQGRGPFYASKDNFGCMETLLLGLTEPEPFFESGQIGDKEKIYQEARANRRIYQNLPKLAKNTVRYVAFSPVDELPFNPDVLVITATPPQGEILLRALSYSTGKPLSTRYTPVLVCSWIFFYPFVSGEVNYTITGLGYGMRLDKPLPEGLLLISVPHDIIPMLIENLHEMDWVLPITTLSDEERGKYSTRVMEEIKKEYTDG